MSPLLQAAFPHTLSLESKRLLWLSQASLLTHVRPEPPGRSLPDPSPPLDWEPLDGRAWGRLHRTVSHHCPAQGGAQGSSLMKMVTSTER